MILSLFLIAKAGYLRNIKTAGETEALAAMINGIPDMFYLSILYGFGIYYRKKTCFHLRFFASIGLMILGPGLGRFLIAVCGLPFTALPAMIGAVTLFTLGWLIVDIVKKRSAFPMGYFWQLLLPHLLVCQTATRPGGSILQNGLQFIYFKESSIF